MTIGYYPRFNNHAQTPHGFALPPGVWSTAYQEVHVAPGRTANLLFY